MYDAFLTKKITEDLRAILPLLDLPSDFTGTMLYGYVERHNPLLYKPSPVYNHMIHFAMRHVDWDAVAQVLRGE